MKKAIQLILIICLSTIYNVTSAQDMSGEWNGILQQSKGGAASSYYFTLNLKQKGSVITGTSKVAFVNNPQFYAVMEIRGKFKNDVLTFEELTIKDQKIFEGLNWCLKKAKLNFTMQRDGFCIEGTWSGQTSSGEICSPGMVKLCKIVPMANQPDEIEAKNRTYVTIQ